MSVLGQKQSADIAALRAKILPVVDCTTCSIGMAIDVVGRHWYGEPHDWKGEKFGHQCPFTKKGATPEQDRRLQAIEAEYTGRESAA